MTLSNNLPHIEKLVVQDNFFNWKFAMQAHITSTRTFRDACSGLRVTLKRSRMRNQKWRLRHRNWLNALMKKRRYQRNHTILDILVSKNSEINSRVSNSLQAHRWDRKELKTKTAIRINWRNLAASQRSERRNQSKRRHLFCQYFSNLLSVSTVKRDHTRCPSWERRKRLALPPRPHD